MHHPGAVPRVTGVIICISVVPTSAGRPACPCAPSSRDFPRPRCCGLIASFPGPCASSGGRLPGALFMVFQSDSKGAKACTSCRSRQELSSEYLLAKFCVDTAENEPLKVCQKLAKSCFLKVPLFVVPFFRPSYLGLFGALVQTPSPEKKE